MRRPVTVKNMKMKLGFSTKRGTDEVVHEIGLCPHPVEKWLGGSPDGVSESGKLVEIKCPPQRSDHTR
jgi:hypothetical protein